MLVSIKKFLIIFLIIFSLFCGINNCFAYNPDITRYHTDIRVNTDRKCNVTEYIKAVFYSPMQGITKIIPLSGYYRNKTKANEEYSIKISNIDVNKNFSIYKDFNNNEYINIGSKNKYVQGEQQYKINYLYKISKNKTKNSDEFYFNLIDTTWNVPISNFSFTISMPKDFDENKIHFYDKFGESILVEYIVEDNIIKGTYLRTLYPNEFLSIKIDLPYGYYEKSLNDTIQVFAKRIIYGIPFLILFLVATMWYMYDKNGKINKIYDGYPPAGFNAVDLAYICYHHIDTNFIPSLLIHLANKNYIQIEESDILCKEKDFKIKKIREYEENDIAEQYFMNALFRKKKIITSKDIPQIKNDISSAYQKIINATKEKLNDIFDYKLVELKNKTTIIMFLTWLLACIFIGINIGFGIFLIYLIIFPVISYFILSNGILQFIQRRKNALWILFIGCILSVLTFSSLIYAVILDNIQFTIGYFNTLICIIGMDILRNCMPYVSGENCILYGKILGFKNFIIKADKYKIKRLIEKDKNYFYKIFPFAYVFGLNKKRIFKIDIGNCGIPSFYGGNDYNRQSFTETLITILNQLSNI